ncbi:glycoside hydrolase, family 16 [Grosmannia clavigera kw1407]|uniref:Glycoside hydrolase, family 16 n=1 Tax=Grosmannia clavigera (strain kw1407 / UAMH 11150) TaxID=655863 RepID=F0XUG3_GROCL|nr:glycoside hydrolase, family 16 [Grosmannia clavigera kw1407]EFW98820.1 glycoside hydrolase, family 16 [Grosmannia clavigera kw1407]
MFTRLALADCDCGYSAVIDDDEFIFTDLIETDFAHLSDISTNTDWMRQAFNVTKERNRGSYSEMYSIENVYTDPITDGKVEDGTDRNGNPAGLDLVVKADLESNMVPVSEIGSNRMDILFGTFRAGMKLTNVPGTCSAFFWYFNDTQEIDMEFLSKDYNSSNSSYPVNLVIQSREAAEMGYNAQITPGFIIAYLPFDPTGNFHEYRFDFLPGRVLFYADNQFLGRIDGGNVPTHSGHLSLEHWSNGNALWSGGPPTQNAITTVSYVKAYFNSSALQRQQDWHGRCRDATVPGAICSIPEVTATNNTPSGWFFSSQDNMTNNQTVSGMNSAGTTQAPGVFVLSLLATVLVTAGWGLDIW